MNIILINISIIKKNDSRHISVRLPNSKYYSDYDIQIVISQHSLIIKYEPEKYNTIIKYFTDKYITSIFNTVYSMSKEQAKDFLIQIKCNFIYLDVEKSNLW